MHLPQCADQVEDDFRLPDSHTVGLEARLVSGSADFRQRIVALLLSLKRERRFGASATPRRKTQAYWLFSSITKDALPGCQAARMACFARSESRQITWSCAQQSFTSEATATHLIPRLLASLARPGASPSARNTTGGPRITTSRSGAQPLPEKLARRSFFGPPCSAARVKCWLQIHPPPNGV